MGTRSRKENPKQRKMKSILILLIFVASIHGLEVQSGLEVINDKDYDTRGQLAGGKIIGISKSSPNTCEGSFELLTIGSNGHKSIFNVTQKPTDAYAAVHTMETVVGHFMKGSIMVAITKSLLEQSKIK